MVRPAAQRLLSLLGRARPVLPTDRDYDLGTFFRALVDDSEPRHRFRDGTDPATWRSGLRAVLCGLLGAPRPAVPLAARTIEVTEHRGYVRELVIYDTEPHSTVTAYVLRPKVTPQPRPAVVCLHGHGPIGKANVAGAAGFDLRRHRHIARSRYNCAENLARRGWVCLCPDARGWGDRSTGFFRVSANDERDPFGGRRDPCNVHALKAQALGLNLVWLNLWDDMRGLDYLQSRPDVDDTRIACAGLSLGGTRALWLSAMDQRIRATVAACALTTLREQVFVSHQSCGSQLLPGMLLECDLGELAALTAPRPLLCESGDADPIFSVASARDAFSTVARVYAAAGAKDRCEHLIFRGGHRFEGHRMYDFLDSSVGRATRK